jgi:hypothetical protein
LDNIKTLLYLYPDNKKQKKDMYTENQITEIKLLVLAMKETLLSSVSGTAEVAKAIQLYLYCEYSEAVSYLLNNLETILNNGN